MKIELYKKEFKRHTSEEQRNFSIIKEEPEIHDKKHPIFQHKTTFRDEKTFIENYGNPMFSVLKDYAMVVVERDGDKVALKLFYGHKYRRPGVSWFKISKNVNYISVNTKTGDVYVGYIHNFQRKIKCTKSIKRNYFANEPLNIFKSVINNTISSFDNKVSYSVANEAISTFMYEIDKLENFEGIDFNNRLFRFYLDKRGIKYPNNFSVYAKHLVGKDIRKILKKNDNRLVDAFMIHNQINGKKVKRALHKCSGLNVELYQVAKNLFGGDWLNQDKDPKTIIDILEFPLQLTSIPSRFKEFLTTEELRRVYKIFKEVFMYSSIDMHTFQDHVRMYTELKLYGENDIKWMSIDNQNQFREEHLNWTEKLQYYKRGNYFRKYPQYMYDTIEKEIDGYTPIILDTTAKYNEESSFQNNCVKTYIGRPSSLIISLRDKDNERATLEYRIQKVNIDVDNSYITIKRVQSLGRYNNTLSDTWNEVLLKLDKIVLSCIEDERFDTVKIEKKCGNGINLSSDTYWDDIGDLRWTFKEIEHSNTFYLQLI